MIINGRQIASEILEKLKRRTKPSKILAAVLVGNDPASISFLKQKEKTAALLGINFRLYKFSAQISEKKLKSGIVKLNKNPQIGGIILQLPLPRKINREAVIHVLETKKDVDALRSSQLVLPPVVGVLKTILENIHFNFKNKNAVVIGRGILVGEPIAKWLRGRAKKLTVFHSRFFDKKILKKADLVISGVGKAGLILGGDIKKGSVIIDFGYSFGQGKVSGDFDFESCRKKARFITPTPGGTGPILVAKLFENYYQLT